MDIVVRGRNVEVPEHYRQHVAEKLHRIRRYDGRVIRVDVELYHEPNRRQSNTCQRVEITCQTRGPVVRSEASAQDFYVALDTAVTKLEARLRRAADRRRSRRGSRTPAPVATATRGTAQAGGQPRGARGTAVLDRPETAWADEFDPVDRPEDQGPGRVVREKEHTAKPMSIDQALFEMELVGHDFYLFSDVATGLPSVVYRRRGYDYGVIRLVD